MRHRIGGIHNFKCQGCGHSEDHFVNYEKDDRQILCPDCQCPSVMVTSGTGVEAGPYLLGATKYAIKQHPTNSQENLLATYKGIEERGELGLCDDKNVQDWVTDYYKHRDGWRVKSTKQEDEAMKKRGLL